MLMRAAATLAGTLLIGFPALAQELVVEQQVERVIVIEDEEGGLEMELLPAETVKPGEQLFYMRWTFNREIGPKDSGKIFFAAVLKENARPVTP